MSKLSQGAKAVDSGVRGESLVETMLKNAGYAFRKHVHSLNVLIGERDGFFPDSGCFASQCKVPLVSEAHRGKGREAKVDFVVLSNAGEVVLVSVKKQDNTGTVDQKLEYEIQQLRATELPAALFAFGDGFNQDVLNQIWDRTRWDSQVLLFRQEEKFIAWLKAGLPVRLPSQPFSHLFNKFCDREP